MRQFLGTSAVLKIPLHWIFLIVPFGFALLTVRLIQGYIRGRPWEDDEPLPTEGAGGDASGGAAPGAGSAGNGPEGGAASGPSGGSEAGPAGPREGS